MHPESEEKNEIMAHTVSIERAASRIPEVKSEIESFFVSIFAFNTAAEEGIVMAFPNILSATAIINDDIKTHAYSKIPMRALPKSPFPSAFITKAEPGLLEKVRTLSNSLLVIMPLSYRSQRDFAPRGNPQRLPKINAQHPPLLMPSIGRRIVAIGRQSIGPAPLEIRRVDATVKGKRVGMMLLEHSLSPIFI